MRAHFWNYAVVSSAAVVALALVVFAPAPGQAQAAKATKAVPRLQNGKPDLTGVWDHPRVGDFSKDAKGCVATTQGCSAKAENSEFPWTPAGKAANDADPKFDYGVHCLPWGYVRSWGTPYPLELIQKDQRLAILFEQNKWFHVVPTDGRKLDVEVPTWMGTSVGHWEGDTLVVDAVGFNEKTWLDAAGHPHTEQLHVIERYTRVNQNILHYQATIEDPGAYSKPWTAGWNVAWQEGLEPSEYVCQELNKDVLGGHMVGLAPGEKHP